MYIFLLPILLFFFSCDSGGSALECATGFYDCSGECDGTAVEDSCEVCNGDGSSCATTFSLGLSGDSSEFLDDSGNIDQTSEKAVNFKTAIAGEIEGADPSQIKITGVDPIRNDAEFYISFIFIEIPDLPSTISVEECVSELMDLIADAIEEGELNLGDYTVSTDDVAIANLDEDVGCPPPFELDECLTCDTNPNNDCIEDVLQLYDDIHVSTSDPSALFSSNIHLVNPNNPCCLKSCINDFTLTKYNNDDNARGDNGNRIVDIPNSYLFTSNCVQCFRNFYGAVNLLNDASAPCTNSQEQQMKEQRQQRPGNQCQ